MPPLEVMLLMIACLCTGGLAAAGLLLVGIKIGRRLSGQPDRLLKDPPKLAPQSGPPPKPQPPTEGPPDRPRLPLRRQTGKPTVNDLIRAAERKEASL